VETDTGHGGGTPTSKEIEETTDVFAFLVEQLGIEASRIPEPPAPPTGR
jgi:prolyl oligopeptidase